MGSSVKISLKKSLEKKMHSLRQAYVEAEQDPDRKEVINDWKVLDGEDWEE